MAVSSLSKQIGQNIKKYREMAGLKQNKLAELVNMENETISRIESGKNSISLSKLELFAKVLNVPVIALIKNNSDEASELAENITEMLIPLSEVERKAIVKFIHEGIHLLSINKEI